MVIVRVLGPLDWTEGHEQWRRVLEEEAAAGRPADLPKKIFIPKQDLPQLRSYKGPAGKEFWDQFPKNHTWPGKSLINADRLELYGLQLGLIDLRFEQVLGYLRDGALLGCRGEARLPTRSKNSPSAYQFGPQVTDAIATWVVKGFAHGPVLPQELPRAAKVNGIMVREKPNGSARIILNLSAPKGRGVNAGIDKDEFAAKMSSTKQFLGVLERAGRGCRMVKIDWSDAYKHCPVAASDLNLQWFEWLGRYFCELDLIFGGVSSVSIFDRVAKVVLSVVQKASSTPAEQICQHLDDVCAAGPEDMMVRFDETYKVVAERIGVKLAPRDDPEKSFGPSTQGVVLGVHYDTVGWTWAVPKERLDVILALLHDTLNMERIPAKTMETLVGKILHVKPLVPGSRFHVDKLQLAIGDIRREERRQEDAGESSPITVRKTPQLVAQLLYWKVLLPACSGRVPIPKPGDQVPVGALDFYTDAAGGSLSSKGHGVGAVGQDWWAYMAWPRPVNDGKRSSDGKRLGRKLSLLELVGPLLVVSAGAELCKGKDVCVWVDNAGSVQIFNKGYSTTCSLCSCVARAIGVVAARIGCRIWVRKITRCSTAQAEAADAISKADFARFLRLWQGGRLPDGGQVPRSLLRWMAEPDADAPLGELILEDIGLRWDHGRSFDL